MLLFTVDGGWDDDGDVDVDVGVVRPRPSPLPAKSREALSPLSEMDELMDELLIVYTSKPGISARTLDKRLRRLKCNECSGSLDITTKLC